MTPKRFVYVLKTRESTPRHYVGLTSNVEARLAWHNQGHCTHTAKYRALRAAQLRMLTALRAGRMTITTAAGPIVLPEHPIFWAGFVLIGEPE